MMLRQGVLEDRAENWIHRKTNDSDIFFTANQEDSAVVVSIPVPERSRKDGAQTVPEAWDPYTGKISLAGGLGGTAPDSVYVTLEPGKSMFVVLNHGKSSYKKAPVYVAKSTSTKPVGGTWDVEFVPKMDEKFSVKSFNLKDFSQCDDQRIQFFAGTATYTATIQVDKEDLAKDKRIVLDLGELNDLVEVSVNGKKTGVLWYPPFKTDITDYLKGGENVLSLAVTNNWANRMIGDERFEPDFEWGYDRGETFGKGIKAFPEWFMKDTPRPSKDRKSFFVWTYFRPDSQLEPAGLVGPVNLEIQSL
jgi:hypothetical protein